MELGNERAGRVQRTTEGVCREGGNERTYWGMSRGNEPVEEDEELRNVTGNNSQFYLVN